MATANGDGGGALHTRWALWFHGSKNNNWGRDSYAILDVASRASDVAQMRSFFEAPGAPEGSVERRRDEQMLFFMREVRDPRTGRCRLVYPIWEDSANVNGGTVCVSGGLAEMHRVFWDFVVLAAGESLFAEAASGVGMVNGVSIGSKRDGQAATVKVWCRACPSEALEAGATPGACARAATRGWCAAARDHVERREAYFVPYKKVSQKDRRDSDRKLAAEYSKEKRLQDSELSNRRQRRRYDGRGGRNRQGRRGRERGRGRGQSRGHGNTSGRKDGWRSRTRGRDNDGNDGGGDGWCSVGQRRRHRFPRR